jgi:D-aminopeptidase
MNGFGKAAGFEQVRETGYIQSPILLTNTLSVGTVLDAGYRWMLRHNSPIADNGRSSVNVVVAECNDSFLNDMRGFHITQQHVWDAIAGATDGPVTEGAVGAATGTACYQFKGGIGTASRQTPHGHTVGALVQTNMGLRAELRVFGARVGKHLTEEYMPEPPAGSVIVVVATDAPATVAQLGRVARRVPFGLARTGATCAHGSGDFAIAFTTGNGGTLPDDPATLDALFAATVEATEEAVLNALFAAKTVTGKNGHTLHAIPVGRVREITGL